VLRAVLRGKYEPLPADVCCAYLFGTCPADGSCQLKHVVPPVLAAGAERRPVARAAPTKLLVSRTDASSSAEAWDAPLAELAAAFALPPAGRARDAVKHAGLFDEARGWPQFNTAAVATLNDPAPPTLRCVAFAAVAQQPAAAAMHAAMLQLLAPSATPAATSAVSATMVPVPFVSPEIHSLLVVDASAATALADGAKRTAHAQRRCDRHPMAAHAAVTMMAWCDVVCWVASPAEVSEFMHAVATRAETAPSPSQHSRSRGACIFEWVRLAAALRTPQPAQLVVLELGSTDATRSIAIASAVRDASSGRMDLLGHRCVAAAQLDQRAAAVEALELYAAVAVTRVAARSGAEVVSAATSTWRVVADPDGCVAAHIAAAKN
jgi:hypothetical protein